MNIDLSSVQTLVLQVVGTLLICFVAVKLFVHFVQSGWGAMVALAGGALVVGWFIWFPDSAIGFMQTLIQTATNAA